jgi:ABC-type Fe3+/spermidine/putrescine transport system ATPase subunit
MVSTAFFMIADLDSPRNGIINVVPQNLKSVSTFIREQQAVFSAE